MSLQDLWNNIWSVQGLQNAGIKPTTSLQQERSDRAQNLIDRYGSDTVSELVGYDDSVPGSNAVVPTYSPSLPVTYVAGGNSANYVNQNSSEESLFGEYDQYMQFLKDLSESNTARSVELADRQNSWQAEQNKIAMDFSSQEAKQLRDWQEYMSNTAHQREVQDLIAAGLNPVLSASGSGAPVGSAQAASGVTSSGARGSVDDTFSNAAVNFLGNTMNIAAQLQMSANSAAAAMASKQYDWDKKFEYANAFPSNGWRIFDSTMNSVAEAAGFSSWTKMVAGILSPAFENKDSRPITAYTRPPQYNTL